MTFVFDSLLSGSQTMGSCGISDDSVNAELAHTTHALWDALNPQHSPIFGRWVRGQSGNKFDDRVDSLAKLGLGKEGPPRRVYWRDVGATVDALQKPHTEIRPNILDLTAQQL